MMFPRSSHHHFWFFQHTLEALPNVSHLRKLMRQVYEDRDESQRKGMIASKYVTANFNLTKIGEIAKKVLFNR